GGIGENDGVGALVDDGGPALGENAGGGRAVLIRAIPPAAFFVVFHIEQLEQLLGIGVADANELGHEGRQLLQLLVSLNLEALPLGELRRGGDQQHVAV